MSGYRSRTKPFDGVHDSIFARAIVFSDGKNKAAIFSAEIIGFSNAFCEETARLIELATGIKPDHLLLTAVHNHSGPITRVYQDDVSPAVAAYADDGKGNIQLGRNPYGPCDHEVGVVRIDDARGNILSLLLNWPCHAVVTGPRNYLISGDWPGAASRHIEDSLGHPVLAPILIGASGDINPIYGPHIDFVDVNGEVFSQIGVQLRNLSPYRHTFFLTHCNGSCGYLVSDAAIPRGGYEVRSTSVASGAESGIIEGLLEMINDLSN